MEEIKIDSARSPAPPLRTILERDFTKDHGLIPVRDGINIHQYPTNLSGMTQADTWDSCCISMDREAVRFFSLLMLTFFILGFLFWKIAVSDVCDSAPLWGLVGSMIGFWFDGPKVNSAKKN